MKTLQLLLSEITVPIGMVVFSQELLSSTLWNLDLNDTVHITEGSFCMPR